MLNGVPEKLKLTTIKSITPKRVSVWYMTMKDSRHGVPDNVCEPPIENDYFSKFQVQHQIPNPMRCFREDTMIIY